jgi:hypothetical protein
MSSSQAWWDFLGHLREITQLLRADPSSSYAERRNGSRSTNLELTSSITKAAMLLTSGRLQGCVASQVQEFLEGVDQSEIGVEQIPDVLKAHLSLNFPRSQKEKVAHVIETQKSNAPLWIQGAVIKPGTIKTGSLPDAVWNPWPDTVQKLLGRCEIDVYEEIERDYGPEYLSDLRTYVSRLVEFRNQVAHGDEPQPVGLDEVWRALRWSVRLSRATDRALGRKLATLTGGGGW